MYAYQGMSTPLKNQSEPWLIGVTCRKEFVVESPSGAISATRIRSTSSGNMEYVFHNQAKTICLGKKFCYGGSFGQESLWRDLHIGLREASAELAKAQVAA